MGVGSVEELLVFKRAHQLTLELYQLTGNFPSDERYGLISQIRRASSSIGANFLEGSHRNNRAEYRQFSGIARGSVGELKYHLLLSRDLQYISAEDYDHMIKQIDSISKMLYNLIPSLTPKSTRTPTHSETTHKREKTT